MTSHEASLTRRAMLGTMFAVGGMAAGAPSMALAAHPLSLGEVIRRNTLARGGAAALDRMHSLLAEVDVDEAGQTVGGPYAANKAGMVRVDIYAGGKNVYSEGVDLNGVWRWTGGPEPAQPSVATGARNALTNGAEDKLFGWDRFAARGHRLALMPPALLDGVRYQVVEVRYASGHVSYFYVNPATWQAERRRDERAYHPDNDPAKKQIEFALFRLRCGGRGGRASPFDRRRSLHGENALDRAHPCTAHQSASSGGLFRPRYPRTGDAPGLDAARVGGDRACNRPLSNHVALQQARL